jgi:error-prone DNA polymerase
MPAISCIKTPSGTSKKKQEMERLFRNYPEAISNARVIADACTFDLKSLKYKYPSELTTDGRTPMQQLEYLTWKGANEFYNHNNSGKSQKSLEDELEIINELDVPDYFLTVEDYVTWATNQHILCQGRGSAANSAVCFVLGITSVAPDKSNLLICPFPFQGTQ